MQSHKLNFTALLFSVFFCANLCSALSTGEETALRDLAAAFPYLQAVQSPWSPLNASAACTTPAWTGVVCSGGSVVNLVINPTTANSTASVLPASIGNLSNVTRIVISKLALANPLPSSLWTLSRVTSLSLTGSSIPAALPDEISQPSNLQDLYLEAVATGPLPAGVGLLPNLRSLRLVGPGFSGEFPSSWGTNWPELTSFSFSKYPQVNGTLDFLCNLTKLKTLGVSTAGIRGSIPSCLNRTNIEDLLLYDMSTVEGSLPENIGFWSKLSGINLQDITITGTIPESIGNSTTLTGIQIVNTQMSGTLPRSLSNMKQLKGLNLDNNKFNGTLPDMFGFTELISIYLPNNYFTGQFQTAAALSSMTSMIQIWIPYNSFTGDINDLLQNHSSYYQINVRDNQFHGPLDGSAVSRATALQYLEIPNNPITGELPMELTKLPVFISLVASNCSLSGEIPDFSNTSEPFVELVVAQNSLSYCFQDLPGAGRGCNVEDNPLLCVCGDSPLCRGSPCTNCTTFGSSCVLPPQPNGFPTRNASRCASGIVADGVCCNVRCGCGSCFNGTCSFACPPVSPPLSPPPSGAAPTSSGAPSASGASPGSPPIFVNSPVGQPGSSAAVPSQAPPQSSATPETTSSGSTFRSLPAMYVALLVVGIAIVV